MGILIDHTGKPRPLRPAYSGGRLRWPANPTGPEVDIGFEVMNPTASLPTRRALICSTAAITAHGMTMDDFMTLAHLTYTQGASIDLGNAPWNDYGQQTTSAVAQADKG